MTTPYSRAQLERVRGTCLYVATKLGDLLDEVVVVGGLVPSLIIDQRKLSPGTEPHLGTLDLDLGLALALLDNERYRTLSERLREAGFSTDINVEGNLTRQRWQVRTPRGAKVTVDFLIPPSRPTDRAGSLRDLERDLAAFIIPGLRLAFVDRELVRLSGKTILGESAVRDVWACGPGAFVALKALAFKARGFSKDAYDLFYVVRNYGRGVEDVAARLRVVLREPEAIEVPKILKSNFLDLRGAGPIRVAQFQGQVGDKQLQADVVGFVTRLLQACETKPRQGRRSKRD
jgi:hypothetical protein